MSGFKEIGYKEVVVDSHMFACDACGSVVFESSKEIHELFHVQLAALNNLANQRDKKSTFEEMVDSEY